MEVKVDDKLVCLTDINVKSTFDNWYKNRTYIVSYMDKDGFSLTSNIDNGGWFEWQDWYNDGYHKCFSNLKDIRKKKLTEIFLKTDEI
jgi:hypothetical protein